MTNLEKRVEYFNANREAILKKSEELKEAAKEHLAVPACVLRPIEIP